MRKHALAAIIAATTITAPASRAQTPMQQMTPQNFYLPILNDERDNPNHPVWGYLAGVISGANIASVMATGRPMACMMHDVEDTEATANTILRYLVEADMLGREEATLEIAAVVAFAWYFPCGEAL
jgi:hypothetical protein